MSVHPPSFAMVDEAVTTLRKVNTYIATGMDKTIEVMQDVVESDKGCTPRDRDAIYRFVCLFLYIGRTSE